LEASADAPQVAEVRQIKEEEQMVLARMARSMSETYQELCQTRGEGATAGLVLSVEEAAHSDDDVTIQARCSAAYVFACSASHANCSNTVRTY
jgi:hypothetical protein